MSDSNVGARKNRNIRDHLFVVNGGMNNGINGKGEPTDLKIYDIKRCFDAMWFKKAMNDLYDANVKDDNFSILCDLNKKAKIEIKTPVGITKRRF